MVYVIIATMALICIACILLLPVLPILFMGGIKKDEGNE